MTERSWNILQQIKRKFNFILIGGWAVYLWTQAMKSKDIDIIVDFQTLEKIKKEFDLRKNDHLKKYELKVEEIDIDIYVPYYSDLAIPIEKMQKTAIEGFEVLCMEELLILKQKAELERAMSEKGEKDRIDIMGILLNCDVDFNRYRTLLAEHNLQNFLSRLISIVKNFKEYKYLNLNPREFKLRKKQVLDKLKR